MLNTNKKWLCNNIYAKHIKLAILVLILVFTIKFSIKMGLRSSKFNIWKITIPPLLNISLNKKEQRFLITGAGSWLLEMSTNYPLSKFIGIDISPIQPSCIKPKNAEFIEANILERLPFLNDTFDFVFQRVLFSGIPGKEWLSIINELVRVLKPGGFLEMDDNYAIFLETIKSKLMIAIDALSDEYDDWLKI
ncbi:S-adenosyl-L-methionine-dependent methyltransferase [Gigaspora margarita]|uniref:S-adenosyl-L-methionine-dependent methyltransferase n=1 Tax=Gigaspora margarita TaxID=4874 RepID=A0A8H3X3Q9_GIGMA|nr:S-adenosyl-L-methionine-dependent methyltransferase [Gigaspora margarita]